jgi:hypothetical protein
VFERKRRYDAKRLAVGGLVVAMVAGASTSVHAGIHVDGASHFFGIPVQFDVGPKGVPGPARGAPNVLRIRHAKTAELPANFDRWIRHLRGRVPHGSSPDASSWELVPVPAAGSLADVASVTESEAWAVTIGSSSLPGEVLRYTNAAWEIAHEHPGRNLMSLSMATSDDGWAAGFDLAPITSVLLPIRDGEVGEPVPTSCSVLLAVQMIDGQTGWAGGSATSGGESSSCILRYVAGSWERVPTPGAALVVALAMTSPNDGWAIGSEGEILRLEGGEWRTATSPVPSSSQALYYDVALAGPGDGWAVGTNGAATLRLVGNTWRLADIGAPVALFGVDMVDAELGFATGRDSAEAPVVMRYDGNSWAQEELPAGAASALRVDMASADTGWAVGATTALRRIEPVAPTVTGSPTATATSPTATPTETSAPTATAGHTAYLPWSYRNTATSSPSPPAARRPSPVSRVHLHH